uniref:Secreted protein n=1 Tax=Ditylenchus dipsaci TaxID=166011 RepID=A0A915CQR6_9BILA
MNFVDITFSMKRCVIYLLAVFSYTNVISRGTAQVVRYPWSSNRARPTAARENDNYDVAAWYAAHSPSTMPRLE